MRHCSTDKMLADYMSKPLQGKVFTLFRNVLMGWQHISTLFDIFSSTEKCVESNGCLAVKPKNTKLTYAEMVRVNAAVEAQDHLIGNGGDHFTSLVNVDIKMK